MATAVRASISTPVFGLDLDGGGDGQRSVVRGCEVHGDRFDGQRVAKGDQLGGPLGGHDAGEAGDFEDVALGGASIVDQGERFGGHADAAAGPGGAAGDGLFADVDHAAGAGGVEMSEVGHGLVGGRSAGAGGKSTHCKALGWCVEGRRFDGGGPPKE